MQDNSKTVVILAAINKYIATKPRLRKITSSDLLDICNITSHISIVAGIHMLQRCSMLSLESKLLSIPTSSTSAFYTFVKNECQCYIEDGPRLDLKDAKDIIDFLLDNNMCTNGPITN